MQSQVRIHPFAGSSRGAGLGFRGIVFVSAKLSCMGRL